MKKSLLFKLAWVYVIVFLLSIAIAYIPFFIDEQGYLFGLFSLEFKDHLLHFLSALWAAFAALHSYKQVLFYFRAFGCIYFLDAIIGLIDGRGYLDGGIFFLEKQDLSLLTRIGGNMPHIVLGGGALLIGFVLVNYLKDEKTK